jgi:signal transduction histidine kinase/streptogramin lyase
VPIPGVPEGVAKPANFHWTRSGQTWAGLFPKGVARLRPQGWEVLPMEASPVGFVWCWLERRDGTLLCGSFEQGVWRFDPELDRFVPLTDDRAVQSDGVLSLCEDREGNLWVGGRSQGLIQMQTRWLSPIPGTESMERVSSAALDSLGRLWCVSGYGVYLSTEPGQWELVIAKGQKEPGFHPIAVLPNSAGGVWIASRDAGILHCRPELPNPFETVWGGDLVGRLPERGAYSLVSDGADGVWFGTAGGSLGHVTDHTVQLFPLSPAFEGSKVVALARTKQGDVWAGSEGSGLCRFANGAVQDHFTTAEGLPINSIRALHLDGEETLWVGTYGGGLVRIRDGQVFTFDSRLGLPDDMISAVLEDSSGFLWCSANPGLFRLDKRRLEEVAAGRATRIDPLLIGRREGLTGSGPVGGASPSAIALPDGTLCFPHVGGLFRFDPRSLREPAPPVARIEEVWAEGNPIRLADDSEGSVTLPRGADQLDILYTGIHFAAPERLRFRYRLMGADSHWVEAGTQRRASYRRLPPDRYTFELQAAIAEGAWSTMPAILRVELPPYFWQTLWFRVAVWLGAGLAVASAVYARIAQLHRRRAQGEDFTRRLFESQENERRRLANELHDGLEQELLLIKNRAQMAAQATVDPAAARQIQQIEDASALAIAETRALATNLRPYQLDRLGLTLALKSLAQNVSGSSGISVHTDLDAIDGVFLPSGESHLYRVVQEALKNVIRHSGATEANLTLFRGSQEVSLLVQDNGKGFNASAARPSRANVVGGFGVSNMEERIRILGGTLTLESQPGSGTRVLASIPIPQRP